MGDANGDKIVNSLDLATIKKYLTGNNIDINFKNAEIDENGDITSLDAVRIRKYILGMTSSL